MKYFFTQQPHSPLLLVEIEYHAVKILPTMEDMQISRLCELSLHEGGLACPPTPLITHQTSHHSSIERKPSTQFLVCQNCHATNFAPTFLELMRISMCELYFS